MTYSLEGCRYYPAELRGRYTQRFDFSGTNGNFFKRVENEIRTRKELSSTGFTVQPAACYGTTTTIFIYQLANLAILPKCTQRGNRTLTPIKDMILGHACLPIPPFGRVQEDVDSLPALDI